MPRQNIEKGSELDGENRIKLSNDQPSQEMTIEECLLWQELRGKRLGARFRRKQVVDGFLVDFYSPKLGVIIDIDSPNHSRKTVDARAALFAARQRIALRFTPEAIHACLPAVLETIERAMRNELPGY